MRTRAIGGAALAVALVVTSGCSKVAEKATEKAAERAIEEQVGGDAKVDLSDGSIDVQTEDGSFSAGVGEVPEAWPDDVPVLDEVEVVSTTSSEDASTGTTVTISGTVDLEPGEVLDRYREALDGWELQSESESTFDDGAFATATFVLDGRTVTLSLTSDRETSSILLAHGTGAG